jgi:hypothetical protein
VVKHGVILKVHSSDKLKGSAAAQKNKACIDWTNATTPSSTDRKKQNAIKAGSNTEGSLLKAMELVGVQTTAVKGVAHKKMIGF